MNGTMARKKPQKPAAESDQQPPQKAGADKHASKKMFRVPDDIHRQLKILADRNDRPMSREIRAALIRHLRDNGLWPPAESA